MASRIARPSETTARAASPGRRDLASMDLSSAVTGSEVLVTPAARATVVRASVLELAIGVIMALEDIAGTPGISPDSFSGPADRQRPAGLVDAGPARQPAI